MITGACILVAIAVVVALAAKLGGLGIGITIIIAGTAGPCITLLLTWAIIPYKSEKLEAWSYVRSLQATRRPQKGKV